MKVLEIAGLVLLAAAATLTEITLGLAVAGVACLWLAWVNR